MAQDSDTGEKTEEPTGKKLSEAVTKGNIAKSMDINTAAILAVALMLLTHVGGWDLGEFAVLSDSHISGLGGLENLE